MVHDLASKVSYDTNKWRLPFVDGFIDEQKPIITYRHLEEHR